MIGIVYSKNLSPESLDVARAFFERNGEQVDLRVRPNRPLNTVEWALPALVTIWVMKPFFHGLFKKLGEESGVALKGFIASLYSRIRGVNNRVYDSDQLRQLAEGASSESCGRQGPALRFCVTLSTADGESTTSVEVVVPDGLTDIDVEIATTSLVGGLGAALDHQQALLDEHPKSVQPISLIYATDDGWMSDWERLEKEANAARTKKPSGA
jgi:hypothetical protein